MTAVASLPMYDLPELRDANARFWAALVEICRAQDVDQLPTDLVCMGDGVPNAIAPEVVFTQTCGYPLRTQYVGQAVLLARPRYLAQGCDEACHRAFIVVAGDGGRATLEDLRGATFALNSRNSNSGMNLARRLFAPLARDGQFFGEVVTTGAHAASMKLVAEGGADAASVDCVTFALHSDHHPKLTAALRVIAQTAPSPTLPFVTSIATPPRTRTALTRALFALAEAPRYRSLLTELRLQGMTRAVDADYAVILEHETEAQALGYPVLG